MTEEEYMRMIESGMMPGMSPQYRQMAGVPGQPMPPMPQPQEPQGFKQRLQGLLGTGFDDPRSQGLLGLGAALLQASGPSTMPISTGQALGQGINAYTQGRLGKEQFDTNQALKKAQAHHFMNPAVGAGPSSVQEWRYYNSLSPQDQKRFLEMKRAQQWLNLGSRYENASTGESRTRELPPEQLPSTKGAQARATKTAEAEVEAKAEEDKRGVKASSMLQYIDEADKLLSDASSGYLGTGYAKAKSAVGISDKTTQANQQLKLISGWMVSNVPRMEGPQSDFDVKNYREMAAMVGDPTVPAEDRRAALMKLKELQEKYAKPSAPVVKSSPKQTGSRPPLSSFGNR